ncbi:hypothetical protein PHYBLDRAFT_72639 [Phycomyces blakesleeanus NRRL 1555(-)]|uniref:Uncharacterized protein n=1 Tax=Phycomyces blakesleeanus (strain ATCC 8743b / DSM 1359 / FGSC 10004 / NBRC 33097 / NRRL 1555) TaxID=763407 RepID=A0A163CZU1_PHYB8|nr:hypothetical protein PHYBLDRAFT_72639 [Phycomyces blakesleeanus NRRL 1555(-)]OAD67690.1 hypothetical protein PHYBLDRAFT_72639 [Phycomyces blakesleeanus NRRL 1555(-)]|eukprot:XP_018285730.1 hypothetical protein PHYBLDRAFT_72639 [Phycomyces blakesleeanus NRRL 1555(-)]
MERYRKTGSAEGRARSWRPKLLTSKDKQTLSQESDGHLREKLLRCPIHQSPKVLFEEFYAFLDPSRCIVFPEALLAETYIDARKKRDEEWKTCDLECRTSFGLFKTDRPTHLWRSPDDSQGSREMENKSWFRVVSGQEVLVPSLSWMDI